MGFAAEDDLRISRKKNEKERRYPLSLPGRKEKEIKKKKQHRPQQSVDAPGARARREGMTLRVTGTIWGGGG